MPETRVATGSGYGTRLTGYGYFLFVALPAIVIIALVVIGLIAIPGYSRYQARANANNSVKVSNIEIRNQEQRVQIAKQQADIRYQDSVGIRRAQDEVAKTLTPLYVAFEMTQALQAIANSGQNNSVIYIPTNPSTGLPVIPTTPAAGR